MKVRKLTMASSLLAAFVLSVSGCSGEAAGDRQVALVLGTSGSPFYEAMACGAEDEAEKLGLELTVSAAAEFSGPAQTPIVNAVTAQRPAVAVVVPTDEVALQTPLKNLVDAGIQLITVDQALVDSSSVSSAILTDNIAGGKMAAEEINSLLDGKGKVLVITQPPGSSAQDQRVEGFEEVIKSFPGIEYLGPQYSSNDPARVVEIIAATLAAHPDLAAVFATNDQTSLGAVTGLKNAGKGGGAVKLVAYDAATAQVDALRNGDIQALIAQDPRLEGVVAMQTALALMEGKSVESVIMTDLALVREGDSEAASTYEYKATC